MKNNDDKGKSLKSDVEFEVPEEIEKEGVADFIGAASKGAKGKITI